MATVGRHWILTIPHHGFTPFLPARVDYIKGQLEVGQGGFVHWQVVVIMAKNARLSGVKAVFGAACHAELTRSAAAEDYVWKEDTRVANTQFELGSRPLKRNSKRDWVEVAQRKILFDAMCDFMRFMGSTIDDFEEYK